MSESQPESNNFEDFEKLDPLERSPTEAEGMPSAAGATAGDSYDDLVSSSTSAGQTDTPEEDLYSATSRGMAAEAEAVQNTPLVSFDDEPALPAGMGLAAAAAPSAPIQQDSPPTTSPSKDAAKEDCSAKLCCKHYSLYRPIKINFTKLVENLHFKTNYQKVLSGMLSQRVVPHSIHILHLHNLRSHLHFNTI